VKVVLFGATGMVGAGVLIECLEHPAVESILSIGRRPTGVKNVKLHELVRSDLFDYSDIEPELAGYDACFFCLGTTSAGKDEATYRRLTYDLTIAAAEPLARLNPGMTFCFVSGQGTDSTEKGGAMWARVKGATENRLLSMPFEAYMFRPGVIQPLKGVRSRTALYQAFYNVAKPLWPLLKPLLGDRMTTSVNVGRAMIAAATVGYPKRLLDNADINALAARA
jgi:uncharacterized protein YbjT (DUF2867 family)